jgi:UDP-N-acetylmuramate dehydrogenase
MESKEPVLPIGGGTNLLVSDKGIEGAVVSMAAINEIKVIGEDADSATVYVNAGYPLMKLLRFAADKGLAGMEGLAGIPGHLGGAIYGNAGAFGCEIKDVLVNLSVMQPNGNLIDFQRDAINFQYRHADLPEGVFIVGAVIRLGKDDPKAVSKRLDDFMKEKKSAQPIGERSAGCVYKNPKEMFAGKLIDEAGCKGMKVGDIEVSRKHANFFVNRGGGSAADYMKLMAEVSAKVEAASGVVLEPEIRIVGR